VDPVLTVCAMNTLIKLRSDVDMFGLVVLY